MSHTSYCCKKHGCKRSDPDCPVVNGKKKQTWECEFGDNLDGTRDPCFTTTPHTFRLEDNFLVLEWVDGEKHSILLTATDLEIIKKKFELDKDNNYEEK